MASPIEELKDNNTFVMLIISVQEFKLLLAICKKGTMEH